MAADLSAFSDEELERIAGGSSGPDLSQLSDEDLERIAAADPANATFSSKPSAVSENLLETATLGAFQPIRGFIEGFVPETINQIATGGQNPAAILEAYRAKRDSAQSELETSSAEDPTGATIGKVTGVAAGLIGVNPVKLLQGVGTGARALLTAEGALNAGRSLLTAEAARTAVTGATVAAGSAVANSKADLTRGQFAEAGKDALKAIPVGAGATLAARGLLTAAAPRLAALEGEAAANAASKAKTARDVVDFDAATAALPEQRAAVKAANAEEIAAVKADNAAAREAADAQNAANAEKYRAESSAAKGEAKAATKAKQASAQLALEAETRSKPLLRTGLETKQSTLGGPRRAKLRAEALVAETLPDGRKLVDAADALAPEARLEFATGLRRGAGQALGEVRDKLAQIPNVTTPVAPIREAIRQELGLSKLPAETQARALEQIDSMLGQLSSDGALAPAALRKFIEDSQNLAKFGTPNLEAALGQARGRVFQAARAAGVAKEGELVAQVLKPELGRYTEANRQYGIFSDLELGSEVFLRRANAGKSTVRIPKAGKVEPVSARAVEKPAPVEPKLREPLLKPEPQAPEFPGGEEALAAGRQLLEPSRTARAGAALLRRGSAAAGAALGSTLGGGFGAATGSSLGASIGEPAANLWLRLLTPTAEKLAGKAAKLERLAPMMEEALRKGPAEVARLHALFLQRSPDYRKAIEAQ